MIERCVTLYSLPSVEKKSPEMKSKYCFWINLNFFLVSDLYVINLLYRNM